MTVNNGNLKLVGQNQSSADNKRARILVVDDDPIVADSLAEMLREDRYDVATASNGLEAISLLDSDPQHHFGIIITDLNMPRMDGVSLLRELKQRHSEVVPIVVTGFGKIESAVEAVKLGAADYLTKPVVDEELRLAVNKAMNQHVLLAENVTMKAQLSERYGLGNLVGADYRMQKVYDLVEAVAESNTTVLITGESGTGKSMVGHAIHETSSRRSGPFVTFACGSIPETLLESELFGHVKGAFTGADTDKIGKIAAAEGGTLFIDEINSATPALQLKLLRVLQEKMYEPVGSTETKQADVRFVLATNQKLDELVSKGEFREDLYYRINVVNIELPRLSERVRDINILAEHFLERHCKQMSRERRFGDGVLDVLQRYEWPGNVRELENAIERAVVLSRQLTISINDLPETLHSKDAHVLVQRAIAMRNETSDTQHQTQALWDGLPLSEALKEPEKRILLAALEANNWNRQETAKQLDINRTTLYKKIKQYGLDQPAA
ncbi:Transcriptional regulatory protein ZraR [Poriferisphaera corsica]|uniref:Transcriptional regulatory protein ZraR n=1 Tax=Poriferisphaera corsica TaxID=2528020 RepID=A0A517YYN7_9BACT|nr:sigma-54 dependent transcriptional regulator [Poriferisphaera corsica]QDU35352.1 Transcriptional regulatory protein ZraR [Poriferisphaera corsica]